MCSFALGKHLGMELLGFRANVMFYFIRNFNCFPTVVFYITTSSVWKFQFLHIFVSTCYFLIFNNNHPLGCETVSHCGFDLYSPGD